MQLTKINCSMKMSDKINRPQTTFPFSKAYRNFYLTVLLFIILGISIVSLGKSLSNNTTLNNPGSYMVKGTPIFWVIRLY